MRFFAHLMLVIALTTASIQGAFGASVVDNHDGTFGYYAPDYYGNGSYFGGTVDTNTHVVTGISTAGPSAYDFFTTFIQSYAYSAFLNGGLSGSQFSSLLGSWSGTYGFSTEANPLGDGSDSATWVGTIQAIGNQISFSVQVTSDILSHEVFTAHGEVFDTWTPVLFSQTWTANYAFSTPGPIAGAGLPFLLLPILVMVLRRRIRPN